MPKYCPIIDVQSHVSLIGERTGDKCSRTDIDKHDRNDRYNGQQIDHPKTRQIH